MDSSRTNNDLKKTLLEQLAKLDASLEYLLQLKEDWSQGRSDLQLRDIEASLKIVKDSRSYKIKRLIELVSKN